MPHWIRHTVKAILHKNIRPTKNGTEIEGGVIEHSPCLRVSWKEDLKAAIQPEAIHDIGAHATADAIRAFQ